jgi:hypothetical protein
MILINLYNFINLELNNRFDFFLKLFIPSFITLISFYYLSIVTSYHLIKCLLITFILLLLVYILEIDYNEIYLKKFNNYIGILIMIIIFMENIFLDIELC